MSSVDEFTIKIHVSNGINVYEFEVQPSDTIQSIKQKISELTKVRATNIILLLKGAFLENSAKVKEYEIDEYTTIAFEIKLCGPKPADFDWSKLGVPAAPKKVTSNSHRVVKKVTEL
jgi:hypothetical protein